MSNKPINTDANNANVSILYDVLLLHNRDHKWNYLPWARSVWARCGYNEGGGMGIDWKMCRLGYRPDEVREMEGVFRMEYKTTGKEHEMLLRRKTWARTLEDAIAREKCTRSSYVVYQNKEPCGQRKPTRECSSHLGEGGLFTSWLE